MLGGCWVGLGDFCWGIGVACFCTKKNKEDVLGKLFSSFLSV